MRAVTVLRFRSYWFVALATLLAACVVSTDKERADTTLPPEATVDTVATTTTTLPPLVVGPIADWGGLAASTVCVVSEQSYPQVPGYSYDIDGLLRELLAPSGVTVVGAGAPCDATLQVQMSLEGRSADYTEIGTRYTGMLRRFDLTLRADPLTPLNYRHELDSQPSELALSSAPQSPDAFLTYYEDVWATISIEALMQFWGPAVAIELLPVDTYSVTAYSKLCEISAAAVGECLPLDVNVWREWYAAQYR